MQDAERAGYWRANLQILAVLLPLWFTVSLALSVFLVEPLNQIELFGFPLGFWISQQGAIYVFILLILVYARWMDRIEARHARRGLGIVGRSD